MLESFISDIGIFGQLSLVIVLAAVMALIMQLLKQPLIIGHILTGIIVGPALLNLLNQQETFNVFSEIGIALLLFIIGLELNAGVIRKLGHVAVTTALSIFLTIGTLGFLVATSFGFTQTESIFIGLALFFSSTIIIAKVLADKKEIDRLHGQITIGIVLLDDIVATFVLLFIAAGKDGSIGLEQIIFLLVSGMILVGLLAFFSIKILPKFIKFIASSQELLFLFSIAWGFGIASIFHLAGFSVEIGALFAGIALAHLPYTKEISARLKPLRDFFVVVFFITLGEKLSFDSTVAGLLPAVIFSLIVIFIKPFVVMTSLGLMGYTKRTGFKTAINVSQISEFSIIVVVLASSAGLIHSDISSIITLVAIITIATSTYLMQYDELLFKKFAHHLKLFERSETKEHKHEAKNFPLVMFGYKKGGHEFIKTFQTMKERFVVVDYDPEVIEHLEHRHIDYLYGDASDLELLGELNITSVKLVVTTISNQDINLALTRYISRHNKDAVIIARADSYNDAAALYRVGATYVMMPHFIGSERLSAFIKRNGLKKQRFDAYREKHLMAIGRTALKDL